MSQSNSLVHSLDHYLKSSLTAALCHCKYTCGDLLLTQVCSDATLMHCSTGQGKTASSLFCAALHTRLTAALCPCKYTYGDLLFIQVCSDATGMHCSTGQGKIASLLFSAALKSSLTAALCHCKNTMWTFALHPGVQWCKTTDLQQWSGQNCFLTVLCCSAHQADSSLVSLQIHLSTFALHPGVQ